MFPGGITERSNKSGLTNFYQRRESSRVRFSKIVERKDICRNDHGKKNKQAITSPKEFILKDFPF